MLLLRRAAQRSRFLEQGFDSAILKGLGAYNTSSVLPATFQQRAWTSSRADEGENPKSYKFASSSPVSRRLWRERYPWTEDKLLAAPPRDVSVLHPKPPRRLVVTYPFSTDVDLQEHYRSPWGEARIGRILEDLDSLTALVAFEHCDVSDERARPPLLVTAGVEAIELHSSRLSMRGDMTMSGHVVWTGSSSMDVRMQLEQGGERQLTALFTFVARDMLTNRPHPVPPLQPQSTQDRDIFCERQRASQQRKAARAAEAGSSGLRHACSPEGEAWAERLLAAAKRKADLPALADPHQLFMDDTCLENTFTCQPQQRNMHGRVFGGFLMRRAFELAHSTAYMFAGSRPRTIEVDRITFRRPVSVGDLLSMRSAVTHTWASQKTPGKGLAHVQVEASVTQPEKLFSTVTNTFSFLFMFDLRRDPATGACIPPKQVLPTTEQQALEVAYLFGPGGKHDGAASPRLGSSSMQ